MGLHQVTLEKFNWKPTRRCISFRVFGAGGGYSLKGNQYLVTRGDAFVLQEQT